MWFCFSPGGGNCKIKFCAPFNNEVKDNACYLFNLECSHALTLQVTFTCIM